MTPRNLNIPRKRWVPALLAVVALLGSGCASLRERDPFQATVSLDLDQAGRLVVTPTEITVDGRYGVVVVTNNTETKRNFDIDELAVYDSVLPGKTKPISVDEAVDGKSYLFYDHTHTGLETYTGLLIVRYKAKGQ